MKHFPRPDNEQESGLAEEFSSLDQLLSEDEELASNVGEEAPLSVASPRARDADPPVGEPLCSPDGKECLEIPPGNGDVPPSDSSNEDVNVGHHYRNRAE